MKEFANTLKNPLVQLIFLFLALVFLTVPFTDRGWFEPDGISILAGSVNLEQAKQGNFFLLGYFVQPLTYELNHLIYSLGKDAYILYFIPVLLGALAICFLTFALYQFCSKRINLLFSFCLLLFFPEIFFRLLYPNSSVFAMVFFSLSLLFLFYRHYQKLEPFWELVKCLLIGVTSVLAVLFRCDFLLGLPLVAFLLETKAKTKYSFLIYILASLSTFILGYIFGVFRPLEIMEYYKVHLAVSESIGWGQERSFLVFFSSTNICIWIIFTLYSFINLYKIIKKRSWKNFLILLPVCLLLYPVVGKLSSTHYLLAAICFAPFLLLQALVFFSGTRFFKILGLNFNRITLGLVALGLMLQFFSFEIAGDAPFKTYPVLRRNPTYIETIDGPRVLGAYLKGYYQVYQANRAPYSNSVLGLAHQVADSVAGSSSDFMIVGASRPQGGSFLEDNHFLGMTAYSIPFFLQTKGYVLTFSDGSIILSGDNNKATVKSLDFGEYKKFSRANIPESAILVKIPLVSRVDPVLKEKMRAFSRMLGSLEN